MLEVKKVITALYRKKNDYAEYAANANKNGFTEIADEWNERIIKIRGTINRLKEHFGIEYK